VSTSNALARAEAKTRRTLLRVRAIVAAASSVAGAVFANACSTGSAQTSPYDDGGSCARQPIAEDAGDDADAGCETFFRRPCGFPPGTSSTLPGCQFNFNDCVSLCGSPYFTCFAFGASCQPDGGIVDDDQLVVQCGSCLGIAGRRPNGFVDSGAANKGVSAIGSHFAHSARLEAASVHAFRILRRELTVHGAPGDLIAAAKRAERDETKHARTMAAIARSYGVKPARVRVKQKGTRSLEAIALENMVEGCVRETFGALLATWQAERAEAAEVAAAMKMIAVDETRHAALAWSVAAWIASQLDAKARARLDTAKYKAIRDLENQIAVDPHQDLVTRAGLPRACDQRRLLHELTCAITRGRLDVHAT
jgi:hypothetical protein